MNRVLKTYLRRLTNLSTRNKSLLLSRLPVEQFADLHDTDFLQSRSSFDVLQFIIQRRSRIVLCDVQDPRYDKVNILSRRLRKIARTQQFIEEESGALDLFVGYPFVRGKFSDGTPVHAPLLFFPVSLRLDKEQWCLYPRQEAGFTLNRSFALAYGHFNETQVSDQVLETAFEEFPANSTIFRTELYQWLNDSPFRINFNQQLFEDRLSPFHALRTADLELLEKTGELKLYPEAVLGIFPQAGSYLEPDYRAMLESGKGNILLSGFGNGEFGSNDSSSSPEDQPGARKIKEEQILLPFSADASQELVIRAVKTGESVVVQGPPGTGKSQLICNLMADYAAQGKRVLLVCQKRAALDVVFQRLSSEGLGNFIALIHDFRNDRSDLYRQLALQIEKVDEYRKQNYSLDAVVLDRDFTRTSRLIDQISEELNGFRKALFDESECGLSVKELYLKSSLGKPHIDLKPYYRHLTTDPENDFRRNLNSSIAYLQLLEKNISWSRRVDFSGFSGTEQQVIEKILRDWERFVQERKLEFEEATGCAFTPGFLLNIQEVLIQLDDLKERVQNDTGLELFRHFVRERADTAHLQEAARHALVNLKDWDGMETALKPEEIYGFRQKLIRSVAAKQSFTGGLFWDWFSKDRAEVRRVLAQNGLVSTKEDLERLQQLTERREVLEEWLRDPDLYFRKEHVPKGGSLQQNHLRYFEQVLNAAGIVRVLDGKDIWGALLLDNLMGAATRQDVLGLFERLKKWLLRWQELFEDMQPYFLETQLSGLLNDPSSATAFIGDLNRDFDSLVELDSLLGRMPAMEKELVQLIWEKGKLESIVDFEGLYENSLYLAWIHHIEAKNPQLRAVSSLKMREWESQLQSGIIRKQELSRDITLLKLRDSVFRDIEKNRLGNTVTYRELHHQVTKKKKIWPIRKLVEKFPDEVFSLVPCWMASPEAVSAMFPMVEGLFDLVIFDEASQCFSEYGIPAAFRAKQLVVTGDDQQLMPGDLYKIRFEAAVEEEEVTPAMEAESLLRLAAQSLVPYQLTGHYRSFSADLIDFSNRHFYKGSLKLLPDYHLVRQNSPGISYLKVDGIWKDQTNQVEAEKVLELLRKYQDGDQRVGVVTFNYNQQQLIQEMVERESITAPSLFIKNIENVQGDERDIIIFSTAYAPDDSGKLAMRFGSLNQEGGANRLNVAITRARKHIYVVTSLWPEQMSVEGASHNGPSLLKSYLAYARDVSEGRFQPFLRRPDGYRKEWMLKDRLIRAYPEYSRALPFADITVSDKEGNYESLILTDDDLYHESGITKEPHAYVPLALMEKNWKFSRIFSREYWLGRM